MACHRPRRHPEAHHARQVAQCRHDGRAGGDRLFGRSRQAARLRSGLAKKLLAEAGYPKGFKTGLSCTNDRYIADEQLCLAIASMWTRIGVQVDVKTESKATYFPRQDRGETDIWMLGWATLPPMDGFSVL